MSYVSIFNTVTKSRRAFGIGAAVLLSVSMTACGSSSDSSDSASNSAATDTQSSSTPATSAIDEGPVQFEGHGVGIVHPNTDTKYDWTIGKPVPTNKSKVTGLQLPNDAVFGFAAQRAHDLRMSEKPDTPIAFRTVDGGFECFMGEGVGITGNGFSCNMRKDSQACNVNQGGYGSWLPGSDFVSCESRVDSSTLLPQMGVSMIALRPGMTIANESYACSASKTDGKDTLDCVQLTAPVRGRATAGDASAEVFPNS